MFYPIENGVLKTAGQALWVLPTEKGSWPCDHARVFVRRLG